MYAVDEVAGATGIGVANPMNWEYMVREFNVQDSTRILLLEEFLNVAGKDGWELVGVATTPTENFTHLVYLKRTTSPVAEFAPD